jgi:hypothetical protein
MSASSIRVYTIKIPYISFVAVASCAVSCHAFLSFADVSVLCLVHGVLYVWLRASHCSLRYVSYRIEIPTLYPDTSDLHTLYSTIQQASRNHAPLAPSLEFPFRADTSQSGASGGFSLFGFGRSPGKSAQARGEEVPTSCVVDADTLRSVSGAGNGSHKTTTEGESSDSARSYGCA